MEDWSQLHHHLSSDLHTSAKNCYPNWWQTTFCKAQGVSIQGRPDNFRPSPEKRIWLRIRDPNSSRRSLKPDSHRCLRLFLNWISVWQPIRSMTQRDIGRVMQQLMLVLQAIHVGLVVSFNMNLVNVFGSLNSFIIPTLQQFRSIWNLRCKRASLRWNLSSDRLSALDFKFYSRVSHANLPEVTKWQLRRRIS